MSNKSIIGAFEASAMISEFGDKVKMKQLETRVAIAEGLLDEINKIVDMALESGKIEDVNHDILLKIRDLSSEEELDKRLNNNQDKDEEEVRRE